MTVADMKVGDRLLFGTYTIESALEECADTISWLKATRDNVFLSECVIDMVKFDNKEPNSTDDYHSRYGNNNYELSNVRQYLNSHEIDWFVKMHDADEAPGGTNTYRYGDYASNPGFLSRFEDYEIEVLSGDIELPTRGNVFGLGGAARFELFKRKGIRAHTSELLRRSWRNPGYNETAYVPFWVADSDRSAYTYYVDRSGGLYSSTPSTSSGLRPKCKIRPDALVENVDGKNTYRLVPFEAKKKRINEICSDEELSVFLGLL